MPEHPLPRFTLLPNGASPAGISDLACLPAFFPLCTVDIWFRGKHWRATSVTLRPESGQLAYQTRSSVRRRVINAWTDDTAPIFRNWYALNPRGYCVPLYTASDLICFTAAHRATTGDMARFVLYPATYPLTNDQMQITGWLNEVSPKLGLPPWDDHWN
jgi:hypothetical protein